MKNAPFRILVVAPFTHQNGHFVTFPRDISCALHFNGHNVTMVHTRPFRTELDWRGADFERICLRDKLEYSPWWWKEFWARFANSPSMLCLAWIILQVRTHDYDLVLWTDFQAQPNLWPLSIARFLHLYRFRTAFFEHHPPDEPGRLASALLPKMLRLDRVRLAGLTMFVFSKQLLKLWKTRLGSDTNLEYVPWGVWPQSAPHERRKTARLSLGIDQQKRVLLIFGVQAVKRKHIDTLREAASSFDSKKPLMLLFVGASLGQEPHPFTNWRHSTIEVRMDEGFIPEEKVEDYFFAADAIWVNYRDFPGASGALLQAMGFGRLSIASGEGEIGALCREHNLGEIVDSSDADDLKTTLERFVSMSEERQMEWERHVSSIGTEYAWPSVALELMSGLGVNRPESLHTDQHQGAAK